MSGHIPIIGIKVDAKARRRKEACNLDSRSSFRNHERKYQKEPIQAAGYSIQHMCKHACEATSFKKYEDRYINPKVMEAAPYEKSVPAIKEQMPIRLKS
jgi:hypothetical protein